MAGNPANPKQTVNNKLRQRKTSLLEVTPIVYWFYIFARLCAVLAGANPRVQLLRMDRVSYFTNPQLSDIKPEEHDGGHGQHLAREGTFRTVCRMAVML